MNNLENKKVITYSLNNVRELKFNYQDPYINIENFDPESYNFKYGLQVNYKWNLDKELFGVVLDFLYKANRKNEDNIDLLEFSNYTEFRVENLDNIFTPRSSNDFDFDEKYEVTFVSIAISTGRGMLITRTAGTFFQKLIFPIINPQKVILSQKVTKSEK